MPGHDGSLGSHAKAVEPYDCAGPAVHDVTMFGSLSRPGEPQPALLFRKTPAIEPNAATLACLRLLLIQLSNSHFTVVPAKAGTHNHRPSLLRESR
jgi:hypothetical protein